MKLVGRTKSIAILEQAAATERPEMIAVVGRRRVGKTFLVRETYKKRIAFELTGIQNGSLVDQLQNFNLTFARAFPKFEPTTPPPTDWLTAFDQLARALETLPKGRKPVVFLDELPWLGTRKSGFIKGLGYFWNSWASKQNIVVIICGSAASWMIDKVVNDKGGLHNRITQLIRLEPFTLAETELLCKYKKIRLPRYQLLQLYMVMGGVPMYLDQLQPGRSAAENIQAICFEPSGYLYSEFTRLFASLFENDEQHVAVVRALAKKRIGLTRGELVDQAKVPNGGSLTKLLNELDESGFITIYGSYRKRRRDRLYRLTDFYSLFYLTYIERLESQGSATFTQLSSLPAWRAWSGYAFENVCLAHVPQIKQSLGISGISTLTSSFYAAGTKDQAGAQIDLLIERADRTIHLCEAKFADRPLPLTRKLGDELRRKAEVFHERTGTNHYLLPTLLTTYPPRGSAAEFGVERVVVLDDLFKD